MRKIDNVMAGECVLSEICDSQTYVRTMHKLSVFDPTEVGGIYFSNELRSSMIRYRYWFRTLLLFPASLLYFL